MPYKPGWRTSEFWVVVITALAQLIAALADQLPPRYAALGSAIVAGLYALSRGMTKSPTVTTSAPVTVQRVEPAPASLPPSPPA